MNSRKAASVVFGCLSVALLAAAPRKTATPVAKQTAASRYAMPALKPGQFWVTSIPVGLEVYLADKPVGTPVGKTPLILDAKSVGSNVTIKLSKAQEPKLPAQEDLVEFTAQNTTGESFRPEGGGPDEQRSLSITYRVEPLKKQSLIALFQPKSASLRDWARRYPPGRNFSFREDQVRKDLPLRGVPNVFFDLAIDLLRRGGKVALAGKEGWILYEVMPNGAVRAMGRSS